jgi:hypothetical protein
MEATDLEANSEEMKADRNAEREEMSTNQEKNGRKYENHARQVRHRQCKDRIWPLGSWLPPAGRRSIVQQWHGARETSSGKLWTEAAAGRRMTHRAKVARRKEHGLQRQVKDDIAPRTSTREDWES